MSDDPRVEYLLDELANSHATPEEVCKVRDQCRRMRLVREGLAAMFPPKGRPTPLPPDATVLPQVPGYEVEAVLGCGGMGVVFKARQVKLNRPVALPAQIANGQATVLPASTWCRQPELLFAQISGNGLGTWRFSWKEESHQRTKLRKKGFGRTVAEIRRGRW